MKIIEKTILGWIPEEWNVLATGAGSTIVTGGTLSKSNHKYWLNGTINWMNSSEVNKKIYML